MTDDLDVLEPTGSSVTYLGEALTIRPLAVGCVPRLVRTCRPVIDTVMALDAIPDENDPAIVNLMLDLIEKHGERVFEAAAICIDKPADWVARGGIDEFVVLARKVIEVNRDFFVQKLAPLLGGRAAAVAKALSNGGGPTPSSS